MSGEGSTYVSPWQWWPNATPEVTVRDLASSSMASSTDESEDVTSLLIYGSSDKEQPPDDAPPSSAMSRIRRGPRLLQYSKYGMDSDFSSLITLHDFM
eukprot:708168-Amphidinium_carterae.1